MLNVNRSYRMQQNANEHDHIKNITHNNSLDLSFFLEILMIAYDRLLINQS